MSASAPPPTGGIGPYTYSREFVPSGGQQPYTYSWVQTAGTPVALTDNGNGTATITAPTVRGWISRRNGNDRR